jgi:hypothetical protein
VFPIPGTKRIKYLEENAAAFWVELNAEEKTQLEHIFAADKARRFRRKPLEISITAAPMHVLVPAAVAGLHEREPCHGISTSFRFPQLQLGMHRWWVTGRERSTRRAPGLLGNPTRAEKTCK